SFQFSAYDHTQPLVIDPALVWGTFLGGSAGDSINRGIAVDRNGNAYISGTTQATDFPKKNPVQGKLLGKSDAFVTKLDATGQIIYSTYIGGTGDESSPEIALDSIGSAYVA